MLPPGMMSFSMGLSAKLHLRNQLDFLLSCECCWLHDSAAFLAPENSKTHFNTVYITGRGDDSDGALNFCFTNTADNG